jgi:hypothetical protein
MAKFVLSDAQRADKKAFRVDRWMNSKKYKEREQTYFETVDQFAGQLAQISADGEADPQALAALLAVILREDRSVAGWFDKKLSGSTDLREDEGWKRLYIAAAGAIVERYLNAGRASAAVAETRALTQEAFFAEIDNLLARAAELGKESDERAQQAREDLYSAPFLPDINAWARDRLTQLLEEDVLIARDVADEDDERIPRDEREREIQKSALLRLRVTQLLDIAGEERFSGRGRLEQLAGQIVDQYHADEQEIARLVITREDPDVEPSITTRLLAIDGDPDLPEARRRLAAFVGKYVRVKVARWFIFNNIGGDNDELRIEGELHFYRVEPKYEDGDYAITSRPRMADVQMVVRRGVRWVEVTAKRGGEISSLAAALETASGIRTRSALPLRAAAPEGWLHIEPRTLQMLDFLNTALHDNAVQLKNMTMAQFETARDAEEDPRRPTVTSVRLQGRQLISEPQACRHIVDGRALLSVSVSVEVRTSNEDAPLFPMRFELASDHATVRTNYISGVDDAATSRVHRAMLERVQRSLEAGVRDEGGLRGILGQITERAGQQTAERADILVGGGEEEEVAEVG